MTKIQKNIDFNEINNFLQNKKVDIIINFAAQTNVDLAEKFKKETYNVNVKGVKNLVDICNKKNIPIIHISSDYVFYGNKKNS